MKLKKKLVENKDYVIMDATEDESGGMSQFSNVVTLDNLNPPSKLVKLRDEGDDEEFDVLKIEKLEDKFFKGKGFVSGCLACVGGILDSKNINIFIVVRNKVYKYYGKLMVKKFAKIFGVDFDFVFLFKDYDDMKKMLRKDLSSSDLDDLKSQLKKLEKKLNDSSDKKKKKKKKKKDKK